jgi:hypothetical protein
MAESNAQEQKDILSITLTQKNNSFKRIVNLIMEKKSIPAMQQCGLMPPYIAFKRNEDVSLKLKLEFDNHMNITKTLNKLLGKMNKN